MCSAPVLIQPNFKKKFYLQTDASLYGIGAVLSQEGGPSSLTPSLAKRTVPPLHPIAYYSNTFTTTERNYDIYERELLAVMKSLVYWRQYLGWTKEMMTTRELPSYPLRDSLPLPPPPKAECPLKRKSGSVWKRYTIPRLPDTPDAMKQSGKLRITSGGPE